MTHKIMLLLAGLGVVSTPQTAEAAEGEAPPGVEALEEFFGEEPRPDPVQNRFFLKKKRFELTPMVGLVPTNPFARRFSVALGFGYHFNEQLALSGRFQFAPDLGKNDVKDLVPILLQRATDDDFRQPFDKTTLSAALGVTWAPFYGKINLLGEIVVNFDFYIFAGVGFVVQNEYFAFENPSPADDSTKEFFEIEKGATEVRVAPSIGVGGNFFITQTVALKLDGNFMIVPDDKPVYNPDEPPEGTRVFTDFTASVGVALFFPKMKPRLYDF